MPDFLTPYEQDAIKEIINIGVGKAAAILNDMLSTHIVLSVPRMEVYAKNDSRLKDKDFLEKNSTITMGFKGSISGTSALAFPEQSAVKLVQMLVPEQPSEEKDLNALTQATLEEVGNIILNAVVGSISNVLDTTVQYSVPEFMNTDVNNLCKISEDAALFIAETSFDTQDQSVHGQVIILFLMEALDFVKKEVSENNAVDG